MAEVHSAQFVIKLRNGAGTIKVDISNATPAEIIEWVAPVWSYLLDASASEHKSHAIENVIETKA